MSIIRPRSWFARVWDHSTSVRHNSSFQGLSRVKARKAILQSVQSSCDASLAEALDIQARHSAGFMTTRTCMKGVVGGAYKKTMAV